MISLLTVICLHSTGCLPVCFPIFVCHHSQELSCFFRYFRCGINVSFLTRIIPKNLDSSTIEISLSVPILDTHAVSFYKNMKRILFWFVKIL